MTSGQVTADAGRTGIAAVEHYIAMRSKMPLLGLGASIHAIHGGTEFGAEISFDDLKAMAQSHADLLKALEAVQWAGRDRFRCVECAGQPSTGHTEACRVGCALAAAKGAK